MIRHLHPTDSPRLLAFKQATGRVEAFTLSQAVLGTARQFSAVKFASIALSPRAWESCWTKTSRARIQAVLTAGPRAGPLAWEVRELYVRRAYVHEVWDVLEQLAVPAGRAGARRVFIRLSQGSPLFDQARRAGYSPTLSETLYRAPSAAEALERLGTMEAPSGLRPRTREDDEALFRLYCSTTPVESRLGRGQTHEEWAHAIEQPGKRPVEWVLDGASGHITALVQSADVNAGRYFGAAWSNDCAADAASLIGAALSGGRPGAAAMTLVPAHAAALRSLLEDIGFETVQSYDMLTKVLAAPVMEARRVMAAVG